MTTEPQDPRDMHPDPPRSDGPNPEISPIHGTPARASPEDDALLDRLAALALEERRSEGLDPRWDALAAGELAPDELARLEKQAEGSTEIAMALCAFRPLGADFERRISERIGEERAASIGELRGPTPTDETSSRSEAAAGGAKVLPMRRRSVARRVWVPLAAAAALAVVFLRPAPLDPLPLYEARLAGVSEQRSASEPGRAPLEATRLIPGSRLELVLTPEEATGEDVAVALFQQLGGTFESVALAPGVRPEVSPNGAIRLVGTVGDEIALAGGVSTLWVFLARPGDLPTRDRLEVPTEPGISRGAFEDEGQSFDFEIVVEPEADG